MLISRLSEYHHTLLRPFINAGDVVVDCTLGNGHDALFLAEAVGKKGHLYGFDIQGAALEHARARLVGNGIEEARFTLVQASHDEVATRVSPGIGAAVYNLGYLPGGDREIVTKGGTTLRSLEEALKLLRREGVVALTLYYGHAGGRSEAEGVLEYAASLDCRLFKVLHLRYPNLPNDPPALLMIQRAG